MSEDFQFEMNGATYKLIHVADTDEDACTICELVSVCAKTPDNCTWNIGSCYIEIKEIK